MKPARANGLWWEGRLTGRVKHPSHPGWRVGGGVPQNKGACFPPSKALEGTAVSRALCGPSVPNLGTAPPHGMLSELSCSSLCQDPELLHVFLFRDRAGELALFNASKGGVLGERITEQEW